MSGKITIIESDGSLSRYCDDTDVVLKVDGDKVTGVSDPVHHPDHYGGDTPFEAIKVIEAWGLDQDFCLGNVIKYISRAGKKNNTLEDLKKAQWYLNRKIENLSGGIK